MSGSRQILRSAQDDSLHGESGDQIRYRWKLLRAGPLLLDGGSMFGVVPRALWSKNIQPDETGRILLGHNSLLLERLENTGTTPSPVGQTFLSATPSPNRTLIETGSGDPFKYDEKFRKIFGLVDRSIITALHDVGTRCEDIEHVIVTHLHFDHAGGLTRKARPDEVPDWVPPDASPKDAGLKLTFPNAGITVQSREWDDAVMNRSVMTRTYLREHLDPIREHVSFIDSPPPFPPGHLPQREELPKTTVTQRETEILPGIFAFLVPGHTWGQQAIRFTDDRGQMIVFTPDVLPTVNHVGATYNMAYDVEPFISTVTRRWFLEEAASNNWILVLDHEAGHAVHRVKRDGKGWYQLVAEQYS